MNLIATAHPAAHALAALARLAERDLLGTAAVTDLHASTHAHLGERARAWATLDALLPEHNGTVAELIAKAGKAAHETATETEPPAAMTPRHQPGSLAPSRRAAHRPRPRMESTVEALLTDRTR
jgi:hypothetical protein